MVKPYRLKLAICPHSRRWVELLNDPVQCLQFQFCLCEQGSGDFSEGCPRSLFVAVFRGSGKQSVHLVCHHCSQKGCTYFLAEKKVVRTKTGKIFYRKLKDSKEVGIARLCRIYHVPGTVLTTLCLLTHSTLITILRHWSHYFQLHSTFQDLNSEVKRGLADK